MTINKYDLKILSEIVRLGDMASCQVLAIGMIFHILEYGIKILSEIQSTYFTMLIYEND